jgi:hypothetical protein
MRAGDILDCYGTEGVHYAPKGFGLTLVEYLTKVNRACGQHYALRQKYRPELFKFMPPRREYVQADVRLFWKQGYWPEDAFGTLYSAGVSAEELAAVVLNPRR